MPETQPMAGKTNRKEEDTIHKLITGKNIDATIKGFNYEKMLMMANYGNKYSIPSPAL